jgi:hypothetical protein
MTRLRSTFISSGSHFSLFHTLCAFLPKVLEFESNSRYCSNRSFSLLSTLRHPSAISCNSVVCWLLSSRWGRRSSISRRTLERLLTLSESHDQHAGDDQLGYANLLIGKVLKLARSIDKLPPNLVGKLDSRDEVAYTKAKTHPDLEHSTVLTRGKEG